jgi:hypothetical protein
MIGSRQGLVLRSWVFTFHVHESQVESRKSQVMKSWFSRHKSGSMLRSDWVLGLGSWVFTIHVSP